MQNSQVAVTIYVYLWWGVEGLLQDRKVAVAIYVYLRWEVKGCCRTARWL
jgi:hypothetical protein